MNQTHKFFSAFCPRRAHFSSETFLSRARTRKPLASRERGRQCEPARGSLSFSSSSGKRVRDEGPSGFRICAGEPPFGHLPLIAHPLLAHRRPASCRPACPEMTNVTCHRHKGKLSSTTRHGNRVALRRPCCRDARRKERKVYFSEGSTSRFMSALAY